MRLKLLSALLLCVLAVRFVPALSSSLDLNSNSNSTASWLKKRDALIDAVFGYGPGILTKKSEPDDILTWPKSTPNVQGLVWNLSTHFFEINSTVFYSPVNPGKRTESAFFFHHGHSNCVCPTEKGDPVIVGAKCRPGCNSSMPSRGEIGMKGYSWWDLYNVSDWIHSMGYDDYIFSMPLKGINLGPGTTDTFLNTNHWWFLDFEEKGDSPLRYFIEPVVLTANYAKARGYKEIHMAGLSGGGWTTTFAPAIDKRIVTSFPIAGSVPCAMRNPDGLVPNQTWTGNDDEDYEQSCMPTNAPKKGGDDMPGRAAYAACNFTCQYLLAGLEPERFQVQVLHEYDSCCFSPHGRHDQMLAYEHSIRTELSANGRAAGWFTSTANAHVKHEVAAQDKTIIENALRGRWQPGSQSWNEIDCDILHGGGSSCAADVEPGCALNPKNPPSGYDC